MNSSQKRKWLAGTLTALAVGGMAWRNRRWFTVHDVTTGESAAYPELRSRIYYGDPAAVFQAAEQALRGLPGWQKITPDVSRLVLDAETQRGWPCGAAWISVYVAAYGHGQVRVIVRAWSRGPIGDFGSGIIAIRALQNAMDQRLTQESAL